jgi:hypothetical protein
MLMQSYDATALCSSVSCKRHVSAHASSSLPHVCFLLTCNRAQGQVFPRTCSQEPEDRPEPTVMHLFNVLNDDSSGKAPVDRPNLAVKLTELVGQDRQRAGLGMIEQPILAHQNAGPGKVAWDAERDKRGSRGIYHGSTVAWTTLDVWRCHARCMDNAIEPASRPCRPHAM